MTTIEMAAGERLYVGRTKDTPEDTSPQGNQLSPFAWLDIPDMDFVDGVASSMDLKPYFQASGPYGLGVYSDFPLPVGVILNQATVTLDYDGVHPAPDPANLTPTQLFAFTRPTGVVSEEVAIGSPLFTTLCDLDHLSGTVVRWLPDTSGLIGTLKWWDDGSFYYDGPDCTFGWVKIRDDQVVETHTLTLRHPVAAPAPLVERSIVVRLSPFGDTKNLKVNPANAFWQWSDVRGQITSAGKGAIINADGDLVIRVKTRLTSGKYGLIFIDNYVGTNYTSYASVGGPARVP